MIALSTQWKEVLGAGEFATRLNSLLQTEMTTRKSLQVIEEEISHIQAELQ